MKTPDGSDIVEWPAGDTAARVLGATLRRRGPVAVLMLAMSARLYRAAVRARNAAFDLGLRQVHRAPIPTISIGNIIAGGAGKTPFTRWLVTELMARGRDVAILQGGYGDDEAELHRRWQPGALVFNQRDRVGAAAAAATRGANVIVLDDAFQHRRLARDLDIVLVPVETASNHLLPQGPLREPESALARADLIIVTRKTASVDAAREAANQIRKRTGKPCAIIAILQVTLRNSVDPALRVQGPVVAVAGIARPDLMLRQLQEQNIEVARLLAYPDHRAYTSRDAELIQRVAAGRPIITTEKDMVKLETLIDPAELWVIEQEVSIEEGKDALLAMLDRVL